MLFPPFLFSIWHVLTLHVMNYLCNCICMWHVLIFDMLLCSSSVQLEQGTVTSLLEENGTVKGVQYKTKSGEELKAYAPLTIVCDGCFSNLRRALCSPKVHPLHYTCCWILWLMDVNGNMCLGWCSIMFCWAGIGELPTSTSKPWPCYLGQSFSNPILPN